MPETKMSWLSGDGERYGWAACYEREKQRADEAEAEVARIDAVLARRPALDKPTRVENIAHAIATAGKMTDKVTALEAELERAAAVLQKSLPIGEVKAIGLREVAARCEWLAAEVARLQAVIDGLSEMIVRRQAAIDRLVVGGTWLVAASEGRHLDEQPEYRAFRSALKAAKGEQDGYPDPRGRRGVAR